MYAPPGFHPLLISWVLPFFLVFIGLEFQVVTSLGPRIPGLRILWHIHVLRHFYRTCSLVSIRLSWWFRIHPLRIIPSVYLVIK